jgi:hypothetical protein
MRSTSNCSAENTCSPHSGSLCLSVARRRLSDGVRSSEPHFHLHGSLRMRLSGRALAYCIWSPGLDPSTAKKQTSKSGIEWRNLLSNKYASFLAKGQSMFPHLPVTPTWWLWRQSSCHYCPRLHSTSEVKQCVLGSSSRLWTAIRAWYVRWNICSTNMEKSLHFPSSPS